MLARQYDEKLFIEIIVLQRSKQDRTITDHITWSKVFKAQYVSGYKLFSISEKKKKEISLPPTHSVEQTHTLISWAKAWLEEDYFPWRIRKIVIS